MNMSAADAEREAEASREELSRTVEALREKIAPDHLMDEAARTISDAGGQLLAKFGEQVKSKALPLALVGIGVTLLIASNKNSSSDEAANRRTSAGGDLKKVAGDISDAVQGAVASGADAASSAMRQTTGKVAAAFNSASDAADDYGRQARRTASDLFDKEPLIIGGIGVLAGLALATALPSTAAEKRYLAPVRDKAATLAHQGLEDVKDAAQTAIDGVKDELQRGAERIADASG
jgi:hypothetical protein